MWAQVAIKKVLQDKRFKNRELQIMKMMNHPNVVSLKHCFYSTTEKDEVGRWVPLHYESCRAFNESQLAYIEISWAQYSHVGQRGHTSTDSPAPDWVLRLMSTTLLYQDAHRHMLTFKFTTGDSLDKMHVLSVVTNRPCSKRCSCVSHYQSFT